MARVRLWLILAAAAGALALLAVRGALGGGERGALDTAPARMRAPAIGDVARDPGDGLQGAEALPFAGEPAAMPAERREARAPASAEERPVVQGTVVDVRGAPLAGAEVALFNHALYGSERPAHLDAPRPARRARTATDGRFAFPVADAERRYGVFVFAPGFAPKGRNQSPGIDVPFELAPAAELAGRVIGPNAAGAEVLYRGAAWIDGALVEGTLLASDGAGGYAAGGLPVGRACLLDVKPLGGAPFVVSVAIESPGQVRHDIELGGLATVVLRAVHAFTGAPVADAVVSLTWRGKPMELARSDEQGWLRVSVQPSATAAETPSLFRGLSLHAPGMLATVLPWPLDADPSSALAFRLVPAARLRGTVLSGTGTPVAGADVRWIAPLQVMDRSAGGVENGPGSFRALTGPDGRFELPEVLWAVPDAALGVWIDGERRRVVFDIAPEGAGATRELELRLLGSPAIAGCVRWPRRERLLWRSAEEQAPPAATVRAAPAGGGEALEAPCDAAGVFLLAGLPPGEYDVTAADATGQRAEPVRVEVPGAEAESLELVLYPPARRLTGRILTHDGRAAYGVQVEVSATGVDWRRQAAITDADGFFTVELVVLPEDRVEVSLDLGNAQLRRALPVAGGLVWTLPELALVRVRVVSAGGGDGDASSQAPRRFRWRRPAEGDESSILLASARLGLALPPAGAPARRESRDGHAGLANLGYARFSPPPVVSGDEAELELPLGTLELWLELPGDPPREVERLVELPADAPEGVLVIEL